MVNKKTNPTQQKFSIKKRLLSFTYAFNGLKILIREEHNARLHIIASILAIIFSIIFQINPYEWVVIILCIGLVITTEIVNTSIENIADFISPLHNNQIKKIKDLAASSVLISSLTSLIIAMIIFLPKISTLLNH